MKTHYSLIFSLCFSSYFFAMEFPKKISKKIRKKISNNITSEEIKNKFFNACYAKKVTKVKKILKIEPSLINETFNDHNTPLHIACIDSNSPDIMIPISEKKRYRLAHYLLKKGALINAQNFFNYTPLHIACLNNSISIIKLLINNNANTQLTTKFYPPLTPYKKLHFSNNTRRCLSEKPPSARFKNIIYHALFAEKKSSITQKLVPDVVAIIKNFYRQLYIDSLLSSAQYWIWEPICIEANARKNVIDINPVRCCLRILISWSLEEKLEINDILLKEETIRILCLRNYNTNYL